MFHLFSNKHWISKCLCLIFQSSLIHLFFFFLCFTCELTFFYNAWLLPYFIAHFVDDEPFPSATEEIVHNWGEFDKDVPLTSELSRRLAVCNVDWDNITATDIFVVFNSFKSPEGTVLSVKVIQNFFSGLKVIEKMKNWRIFWYQNCFCSIYRNGDMCVLESFSFKNLK